MENDVKFNLFVELLLQRDTIMGRFGGEIEPARRAS